jgi:hypothetical protein
MKKIILLVACGLIFACNNKAQGQTVTFLSDSTGTPTSNNVVNTTTEYFYAPTNAMKQFKDGNMVIGALITKVSGTCSMQCVLEGSIDGTNYFKLNNVRGTSGGFCDTAAVGDATTYVRWSIKLNSICPFVTPSTYTSPAGGTEYAVTPRVPYLRIRFVPAGTMNMVVSSVKMTGY